MQWPQPCSKASDAPPLGGVLSMEAPRRLRCCECRRRLRGGGDVSGQGGDVITSAETSRADGGDVSTRRYRFGRDVPIRFMAETSTSLGRRLRSGRRRLP